MILLVQKAFFKKRYQNLLTIFALLFFMFSINSNAQEIEVEDFRSLGGETVTAPFGTILYAVYLNNLSADANLAAEVASNYVGNMSNSQIWAMFGNYGNWVGEGWWGGSRMNDKVGALPPIDDLDALAQEHDFSYEIAEEAGELYGDAEKYRLLALADQNSYEAFKRLPTKLIFWDKPPKDIDNANRFLGRFPITMAGLGANHESSRLASNQPTPEQIRKLKERGTISAAELQVLARNRVEAWEKDNGTGMREAKRDDTKDPDTKVIENPDMIKDLNSMEQLSIQAQETQAIAKTKHQQAKDQIKKLNATVKNYNKSTESIVKQVNDLISESAFESKEILSKMKELSIKMIDLKSDAENLTLAVCDTYTQLNGVSKMKTVDKLIKNATKKNAEVHQLEVEANDVVAQMENLNDRSQNLNSSIKIFKMKADLIIKNATTLIDETANIKTSIGTLQLTIKALGVFNNQSNAIVGEANGFMSSITNKYVSLGELKAHKKTLNKAKKTFKKINGENKKTINLHSSGIKIDARATANQQNIDTNKNQLSEAVQVLKVKTSGVWEAEINDTKAEITASYEAGKLFFDPIVTTTTNSEICMSGIESRHNLLAESYCRFLGDRGRWAINLKKQKTVCECKIGYYFNSKQTECLTLEEYKQEQAEIAARKKRNSEALVSLLTDVNNVLKEAESNTTPTVNSPSTQPQTGNSGGTKEEHLEDIVVNNRTVTITVWDHGCEDGDKITLIINGVVHLRNYNLVKTKKSFQVNLPSGKNAFQLVAVDSGTDCPPKANKSDTINSAAISVSNAVSGGNQTWLLKQGSSSNATIIVKQ
jgi:hypothetical protein